MGLRQAPAMLDHLLEQLFLRIQKSSTILKNLQNLNCLIFKIRKKEKEITPISTATWGPNTPIRAAPKLQAASQVTQTGYGAPTSTTDDAEG